MPQSQLNVLVPFIARGGLFDTLFLCCGKLYPALLFAEENRNIRKRGLSRRFLVLPEVTALESLQ